MKVILGNLDLMLQMESIDDQDCLTITWSKISPTYPWKISDIPDPWPTVLKEFLSLWGFGEVWGIFPGYVGKIIEVEYMNYSFELLTHLKNQQLTYDHKHDGKLSISIIPI